jgi:hypothetical protein
MASSLDRVDHALDVIEQVCGPDEREMVERKLAVRAVAKGFGSALHIGGYRGGIGLFKSDAETYRRNLARAVVLTMLSQHKITTAQSDMQLTALKGRPSGELEKQLKALFPYKAFRGQFAGRQHWQPESFTHPAAHSDQKYRYLVHTIQGAASLVADAMAGNTADAEKMAKLHERYIGYGKIDNSNPMKAKLMVRFYEEYLHNPHIIRQNIISSSIISEEKHSTYYPFGFIMRVPPECIYITSPKDVSVKNRTSDIVFELNDKKKGAILAPQQVLDQTTGRDGDTGYNEIVVVGTSPEGRQVDVIGLFVKTDGQGHLYMRPGKTNEPYVNAEIQGLIAECARQNNLPIVPIADTSSDPSVTPWPFDVNERAQLFAPKVVTRTRRNSV